MSFMKELVFMRHGLAMPAREPGARGDAGRRLLPEGKAQAEASSKRLKELGFSPLVIISSPYLRAMETADIAAALFPAARRVQEPALISPSPLQDILTAITTAADGAPSVLVVGHQPTLGALCGLMLGTGGPHFTTGSFSYLRYSGAPGSGKAELADFFSPEPL
jgi:phosphohistidine phosphatase